MDFVVAQFLTGLAAASSLFLVASGLSIIFGVTRIVNFAHGAFYMLGAYVAYTLTERFGGAASASGAACWQPPPWSPLAGALVEMLLLRRIYHAPDLFQLLATFGLTLMVRGPRGVDLGAGRSRLGRARPGFGARCRSFGQQTPSYDLVLIVLGPLWSSARSGCCSTAPASACWCAPRRRTARWWPALGVNQKWLFTGVFAVGCVPRRARRRAADPARRGQPHDGPAHHRRDLRGRGDRRPRQHRGRLPRRPARRPN